MPTAPTISTIGRKVWMLEKDPASLANAGEFMSEGGECRIALGSTALSGPPSAFNQRQLAIAFAARKAELDELWRELMDAEEDVYKYLRKLMFDLYSAASQGRSLTVGQACRAIPAKHNETCKKYMDFAVAENLIVIRKSPTDSRKKIVTPTDKLLRLVEKEAELKCSELKAIAPDFAV
jgi:hypothetical protein